MKAKMRLLIVSILIAALVTAAFPAAGLAHENKTYFTGQECSIEWTDPGTWTYLPSGLVRVTGVHSTQYDTSDDARLTGYDYVIINAITDAETGEGNFWGTFNIVNDGGSWFGHWNGQNPGGQFYIDGLLHGEGGYEGLTANFMLRPGGECSLISGYIVETGAGN